MHSLVINTLRRSTNLALMTTVVLATVLFAAQTANSQQLQRGVSVQLAPTTNAAPMPDADNQDAWIVAITSDETLYFGVDPVTPSDLADKMKSRPRNRDQKLYVKADARAPVAAVRRVLAAAHEVGFNCTGLPDIPNRVGGPGGRRVAKRPGSASWPALQRRNHRRASQRGAATYLPG